MYTLDQLADRIIWNFREPRSGSSWFLKAVRTVFNRENGYLEPDFSNVRPFEQELVILSFFNKRTQQLDDHKKILNTHKFQALESLVNYTNPIIIRNTRKNKTEQFISEQAIFRGTNTDRFNIYTQEDYDKFRVEPFSVSMNDVNKFIAHKKDTDSIWNEFAQKYESEIVYYEDLLDNWQSKILPLKLSMKANNISNLPMKLPYDKRNTILNYDEVDRMLKDAFGPY